MNDIEKSFLENVLLTCPETGDKLKIVNTEGSEKGHKHLQITVQGANTSWVHEIRTTEV